MTTLYILLVILSACSVLCAPLGEDIRFQPSGTALSSSVDSPVTAALNQPSAWKTPPQMADLSCFNVLGSPTGNVEVTAQPIVDNIDSTAIRVFYPKGSINPGNKAAPMGGAEFYAAPVSLAKARNVTLEYSVFFPLDFDWNVGGKLPGLYGGHKTCSGGDNALSCFSTRLMWRKQGAGELYLYAPKNKQTQSLCSAPPKSVCESSYGLSIARGSFAFTPGAWTHVKQVVSLNTPGQQDGTFLLEVDGKLAIDRKDVYYRSGVAEILDSPQMGAASIPRPPLVDVVKRLVKFLKSRRIPSLQAPEAVPTLQNYNSGAVGFTGIFFSTFFGGHQPDWASPKDQYAWFKDFAISTTDYSP